MQIYHRGESGQRGDVLGCTRTARGGGAQTITLVKQRLQISQNVWNSKVSQCVVRLSKQIKRRCKATQQSMGTEADS